MAGPPALAVAGGLPLVVACTLAWPAAAPVSSSLAATGALPAAMGLAGLGALVAAKRRRPGARCS